ncbi:hypothetical protein MMC30_004993 [Trapelia coarctata]|nr:hypothetical protein [Trapelia coarctata]
MVDPRRIELHQKLREITLGTHPDIAASGVANEAPFPPTPFSVDTLNPLLAREKWVVEEPIWELLMPVVNLASAIFESEASFIFVYSVINAEPRRDTELSEKFGKDIYFIRKLDPCSTRRPIDQVREESSSNLEYIEREIQFSFFDKRHEYWAAKPAINGSCRGRRNRPTSFSNHARKNIEGRYSKIFIRGDLLDELKHLRSIHPATPKVMASLLRLQFSMAHVICH